MDKNKNRSNNLIGNKDQKLSNETSKSKYVKTTTPVAKSIPKESAFSRLQQNRYITIEDPLNSNIFINFQIKFLPINLSPKKLYKMIMTISELFQRYDNDCYFLYYLQLYFFIFLFDELFLCCLYLYFIELTSFKIIDGKISQIQNIIIDKMDYSKNRTLLTPSES